MMNNTTCSDNANILILDTKQTENRFLATPLEHTTYYIQETHSLKQAFSTLQKSDIHLFLIYSTGSRFRRGELIKQAHLLSPETEVIVVLSDASEEAISNAYDAGAFDVLTLPVSAKQMMGKIQRALEHRSLQTERNHLKQQIAMHYSYDSIIGVSPAMQEIKKTIKSIAPTDIAVLLTGSTGTGKSFLAHVIHHHSNRRHRKIVTVDCSVFQDEAFVHRLFGYGDITALNITRSNDTPAIEAASGGTLLLENIQSLSETSQHMLLQFLRNGSTGKTKQQTADIRFITTADSMLSRKVESGTFNRDLLDRLGVITIAIPTLQQHLEDFELLVVYFLRKIANEHHWETLTTQKPVIELLQQYHWQGNIRELEDTLRQAALVSPDRQITIDTICQVNSGIHKQGKMMKHAISTTNTVRLEENQRELIEKALNDNNWNFTQTAQELGIGRTTLWRKIKKYNLKRTSIPK